MTKKKHNTNCDCEVGDEVKSCKLTGIYRVVFVSKTKVVVRKEMTSSW